jgi:hypothetical protein
MKMPIIVRLSSNELGEDEYEYESLKEAKSAVRRIKKSCIRENKKDGIRRIIEVVTHTEVIE